MAIGITQIATNAYAPDGAQAINLSMVHSEDLMKMMM